MGLYTGFYGIPHENSEVECLKLVGIHWLADDSHFAAGGLRNCKESLLEIGLCYFPSEILH